MADEEDIFSLGRWIVDGRGRGGTRRCGRGICQRHHVWQQPACNRRDKPTRGRRLPRRRPKAARALARAATGQVAALLPADPPQSLKGLAFIAPDGKPMTVADRKGKTLLLNLWATWCAPCRAEMPALDALQKEMGGERFEVVAVNVNAGDDVKPKKFLAETGVVALGYYRDNTLALFNELKTRGLALGLPVTLLLDGEGCLLAHMNGPADWSGRDARRVLELAIDG